MELSKLEFAVETSALDMAIKKLGVLETAIADVNKVQSSQASADKAAAREKEKAAKAAEKAAAAAVKAAEKEAAAAAKLAKATSNASDEQEDLTDNTDKLAKKLSHLQDKLSLLRGDQQLSTTGFSMMQAGAMATVRAMGATEDIVKEFSKTFDDFNKITGQNKFDKSVNGLKLLSSELSSLSLTTEMANRGFNITKEQTKLLGRDVEGLTQKYHAMGGEGKTLNEIINAHKVSFGQEAERLNNITAAASEAEKQTKLLAKASSDAAAIRNSKSTMMDSATTQFYKLREEATAKQLKVESTMMDEAVKLHRNAEAEKAKATQLRLKQEATMMDSATAQFYKMREQQQRKTQSTPDKSLADQARAVKWLAIEEERLTSVVKTLGSTQDAATSASEKAARSIANYERNLKQAGVTGEVAATKLAKYRDQQTAIQTLEERRQGKFLTRALQPQIGDTVVSLAAGQNPLTVLLQQGDQIRGLIAQSGIEGKALQDIMRGAFTQTVTSIKDTAVAMGSVLGGAFLSLGKTATGVITGPVSAFFNSLKYSSAAGVVGIDKIKFALLDMANAASIAGLAFMKIPLVAAIAGIVAVGIAAYQTAKQTDEMNKSLILNGATLGLNRESAIAMAQSFESAGVSTSKAMEVITEMAKVGGFTSREVNMLTTSIVDLEKAGGPAIADTVKQFAKLKEEPVKALIELAKASGMIAPVIIEQVNAFVKQGEMAKASSLAMQTASGVIAEQAQQMKRELSSLGKVVKWLGETWDDTVSKIKNSTFESSLAEKLKKDLEAAERNARIIGGAGLTDSAQFWTDKANAIKEQLQLLDKVNMKRQSEKDLNAIEARNIENAIRFTEELDKREESFSKKKITREQYITKELLKEKRIRGRELSEGEITRATSVFGKEFDESRSASVKSAADKDQRDVNSAMETYNDIVNKGLGLSSSFNNEFEKLNFLRERGLITQRQYYDEYSTLINAQPKFTKQVKDEEDALKDLADAQSLVFNLIGKADLLGANYYSTLKKLESYKGKAGIDPVDLENAISAFKNATPAAKAYASAIAEYNKNSAEVKAQVMQVQAEYSTDFTSDAERKRVESLSKYKRSVGKADINFEKSLADAKSKMDAKGFAEYAILAEAYRQQEIDLALTQLEREKYLQSDAYQRNKQYFDALTNLGASAGKAIGDEFVNFYQTGKSSFEDLTNSFGSMIDSMVADLLRLQIQKQVSGLMDIGIAAGIEWLKGGTGTAQGISGTTSAMSGGFGTTQAMGGAWNNGVQAFAKGGTFTNSIVDSPTMFKFAKGTGLMGEAGPEAIMPLKRDSSGSLGVVAQGGGSSVEVVVNNYGKENATTTETVDSRGNRRVEVVIGDMISGEINRSGSAANRTIQNTFGVQPQLIRR